MAEPARTRMTVEAFLRWNSGDDRRYELIRGEIVAMAPPSQAHGVLASRLGRRLSEALDGRPPCRVVSEAGLRVAGSDYDYYAADLAVTCAPHRRGQQEMPEPILIVEVLSPSTELHDRKTKLPDYRRLGSLQEIALVDSETAYVEVHRRLDGERWLVEISKGLDGALRLGSVGLELPLAALYEGLELAPPAAAQEA
jgi:Uma2 family endonuclease